VGSQASDYRQLIHAIEQRKLELQGQPVEAGQSVKVFAPEKPLSLLASRNKIQAQDVLPLRTVDDYRWFVEIAGVDPATFDIHLRGDVRRAELEHLLSAPEDTLDIADCRRLADPTLWKSYREWTQEWMQTPVTIKLGEMMTPVGLGKSREASESSVASSKAKEALMKRLLCAKHIKFALRSNKFGISFVVITSVHGLLYDCNATVQNQLGAEEHASSYNLKVLGYGAGGRIVLTVMQKNAHLSDRLPSSVEIVAGEDSICVTEAYYSKECPSSTISLSEVEIR
jgi:hypothetical protein